MYSLRFYYYWTYTRRSVFWLRSSIEFHKIILKTKSYVLLGAQNHWRQLIYLVRWHKFKLCALPLNFFYTSKFVRVSNRNGIAWLRIWVWEHSWTQMVCQRCTYVVHTTRCKVDRNVLYECLLYTDVGV